MLAVRALEGLLVTSFLGLLSYKRRLVDVSGVIAGIFVGTSVIVFGSWRMFILLATFHFVAGFFTHYKYEVKAAKGVAEFKRGARSWQNVLANGLIPALTAVAEYFHGGSIATLAFVGAVGASLSDTLSNEVGVLNPSPPRLITSLRIKVPPGYPGGVSPLGTFTAFAAPLSLGAMAYWLRVIPESKLAALCVGLAGAIGSMVDSLIGATLQGVYVCRVCGKFTERRHHCGRPARLHRGYKVVNNHVVNLLMSTAGAAAAVAMWMLLNF